MCNFDISSENGAQFQLQASLRWICGGEIGTLTGVSPSALVFHQRSILINTYITDVISLSLLWLDSPIWAWASSFRRGLMITHSDTPQSVGLLWTRDQLVAETST
jgi:hypothetical protein